MADVDLIVSIGGDGTTLAALRAGAVSGRPVLGSPAGVSERWPTSRSPTLIRSLDRYSQGEWLPARVPGPVGRA